MPVVTLDYTNTKISDTLADQSNSSATTGYTSTFLSANASTGASKRRSFLKFDLGLIPNNAVINSATLRLTQTSSSAGSRTIQAKRIASNWVDNQVSWDTQPTVDATVSGSALVTTATGTVYDFVIKSLVQDWVNGTYENYGLCLVDSQESTQTWGTAFVSVEGAAADRPKLIIDYTIPTTGKKQVEYVASSITKNAGQTANFTPSLPVYQQGDLLLAAISNNGVAINTPVGWTKLSETSIGLRSSVWYKFASTNETAPTFSNGDPSTTWMGSISSYRNVKAVRETNASNYATSTSSFFPPTTTTAYAKTIVVLINQASAPSGNQIPPLSFTETVDASNANGFTMGLSHKYMHSTKQLSAADATSVMSYGPGESRVVFIEPIINNVPTDPTNVTRDKSAYTVGDQISISFTGSTDADGDAITYEADIYDVVNAKWIALATGKTGSPIFATVPSIPDTSAAKVRVRARDAKGDPSNNVESAIFSVAQRDGQILAPVNVVSTAYLVSQMARPVRLNNGWLVGAAYASPGVAWWVSKDNGKSWGDFRYFNQTVGNLGANSFSLVAIGTRITFVFNYGDGTVRLFSQDLTKNVPSSPISSTLFTTIESGQTSGVMSGITVGITPEGSYLWWSASTKNNSLPNSFNIRAGSIPINADGTLGTPGAVIQLSNWNNGAGWYIQNPSVVIKNNLPFIFAENAVNNNGRCEIVVFTQAFTNYAYDMGTSTWGNVIVFNGGSYKQQSPTACTTPNTKLHAVWHGTSAADATNPWIYYSNSSDGQNWLAIPKRLVKGQNASITSDKNGKLYIEYDDDGYIKRIESTDDFTTWTSTTVGTGTKPAAMYDPTFATDFTVPPTIYQATSSVKYYGALNVNQAPTLTLTTADNQTLTEQAILTLNGSAVDPDNGNVLTVKYKLNSGTARAIASGVSDGSTPISFAKTLTYRDKRLWDGSTDVAGADLAENIDHILTVWSEDDKGGKSAEQTRKFRAVWNRPPVIDGSNGDLGTISDPLSKTYTVTDPESNAFTITEKINGTVIRTFAGVAGQQETITIPADKWIRLELDTPHALSIEATDSKGMTATRTYTFTRTGTYIEFKLNFNNPDVQGHFILDGMPERVLITLERYIPEGASIESVKVCNNALDSVPTWEDATNAVKGNRGYLFTNKTKTANNWAINVWVVIAKGTAIERVKLNGYGGAFD
ncbi:DNRLRE domain-containing protein [Brevibacillus fluminis]|uniref:DNRLRE domain-containing protein n=1 Tax=Brevibacillus fluminis TaxID=511487 RepID=UPI003F8A810D